MNLSLKQAALALSAAAVAAIPGLVSAQGVDTLESKLYPRYVTDDMLLNADKDASNWLHYGRDYQTTRYSPLTRSTVTTSRTCGPSGTCPSACWKARTARRSQ